MDDDHLTTIITSICEEEKFKTILDRCCLYMVRASVGVIKLSKKAKQKCVRGGLKAYYLVAKEEVIAFALLKSLQ